jgi:hypothetical protein
MSKMTDQSTRLLCGSVFFNHGKARDTVIKWIQDPNRAVAPELGVDLKLAMQVARFAERRERAYWRLYFGIFVATAAAGLLTQGSGQDQLSPETMGVVAIGVLASIAIVARKQVQDRNEFLPAFSAGRFNAAEAAERFSADLKAKELSALPAAEQNFFVYGGFMPFVGAGYDLGGWSVAIALDKPKETLDLAVPILPFHTGDLYSAIDRELQGLGLPSIETKDCYFANGSDLKGDPALLPDRFGRPVQFLDPETAQRYVYSDDQQVRHYRRYQIVDWGNTLFVETKRFILTPMASAFRVVDQTVAMEWKEAFGLVVTCAIVSPFLLVASPFWAFGEVSRVWHEWWGHEDKERRKFIQKNPLFNYGSVLSLRQTLGSGEYGHYFQKMDGDLFNKALEREVLDSLVGFLDAHGIDTCDLKERQTTILNSGVIVHGGDVRAESLSVGAGSQANANVKKVFRGKGAAKGASE